MDSITFDCRALAQVDFSKQPPVPIPRTVPRRPAGPRERDPLKAALRYGKAFDGNLGRAEEVVNIADRRPPAAILVPPSMPSGGPVRILVSTSGDNTAAFGLAASVTGGTGVMGGAGIYASTTREIGWYVGIGGGIFFNTPSAAIGAEYTAIWGTPHDFSGPYFGISVSGGIGVSLGGTVLFSPTLPTSYPLVLTLMGFSINLSATTPSKLPVTVALVVTDTKISALRRW